MANRVEIVVELKDNASSGLSSLTNGLKGMATVAGGILAAGAITRIGEGFASAARTGIDFNRTVQNLGATLNAYTKSQETTNEMLAWANEEAAKTPFAYQDIGAAIAGLLPAAKDLDLNYQDLIKTTEILAASNPMEGMVGGTFALKEALSGDFTSIIERFNLPRQYINQLKEEGVPNLEIVSRAMEKMGMDIDLVTNLSETFDGRMSTLKDTFTNLAGAFTQPIFSFISEQIFGLQGALDENMPAIEERLRGAGQVIADAFRTFQQAWNGEWVDSEVIHPIHRAVGNFATDMADIKQQISDVFTTIQQAWNGEWVDSEIIEPMDRLAGIVTTEVSEGWQSLIDLWSEAKDFWASGWIQTNIIIPFQTLAQQIRSEWLIIWGELKYTWDEVNKAGDAFNRLIEAGKILVGEISTNLDILKTLFFDTGKGNKALNDEMGKLPTLGDTLIRLFDDITRVVLGFRDAIRWARDMLISLFGLIASMPQRLQDASNAAANWVQGTTDQILGGGGGGQSPSANSSSTTSGGSLPAGGGGGQPVGDNRAMTGGVVIYATVRNDQDINALAYEISKVQKANR